MKYTKYGGISTNGHPSTTAFFFDGQSVSFFLVSTSLQWPLSSVPKMAVVERFNCKYQLQKSNCAGTWKKKEGWGSKEIPFRDYWIRIANHDQPYILPGWNRYNLNNDLLYDKPKKRHLRFKKSLIPEAILTKLADYR